MRDRHYKYKNINNLFEHNYTELPWEPLPSIALNYTIIFVVLWVYTWIYKLPNLESLCNVFFSLFIQFSLYLLVLNTIALFFFTKMKLKTYVLSNAQIYKVIKHLFDKFYKTHMLCFLNNNLLTIKTKMYYSFLCYKSFNS